MYSMKRSVCPCSRKNAAIGTIWSSFAPRLTTAFTFTGRPASCAAVDPLEHAVDREVDVVQRAERRVVERVEADGDAVRPASASACAFCGSSEPLVVSVRSTPSAASCSISRSRSRRTSGSPPVSRILRTPPVDEHARDARDLLERQQLLPVEEAVVAAVDLLRHAVDAAEVAAVGDRDAEIAKRPAEGVEHVHAYERYAALTGCAGACAARPPRRHRRLGRDVRAGEGRGRALPAVPVSGAALRDRERDAGPARRRAPPRSAATERWPAIARRRAARRRLCAADRRARAHDGVLHRVRHRHVRRADAAARASRCSARGSAGGIWLGVAARDRSGSRCSPASTAARASATCSCSPVRRSTRSRSC